MQDKLSENRKTGLNKSDTGFLLQGSILAAASIISRVIGLVYRIPLTAIIGKTGNDYYGTAFEIYNIVLIISSYSIPLAVSKVVAAKLAKGGPGNVMRVFRGALFFAFLTGGAASLILWFGCDFFTDVLKTPYASLALKVLAPVILIVAVLGVFRGFFQGLGSMMPTAVSQILEQITNAAVSIVAAFALFSYGDRIGAVLEDSHIAASYGAAGGTLGTAAGAVMAFVFMLIFFILFTGAMKKRLPAFRKKNEESYGEILKIIVLTIVPVLLSTTIYNISSIVDQTIFKNIAFSQAYDSHQISEWWGVYTGQFKVLINVPVSIASAIASSAVPSLIRAYETQRYSSVRHQIYSATRFVSLIAFPCTIGFMALAKPIMMLLFADPDPVSEMMMISGAVSVLFFSISTLSNGLLQGIDKLRIPVINAAIALFAQAFLLVFLMRVMNLNIYAVVIANAFYALLMCILNGIAIRKHSGVRQDIVTTWIQPMFASIFMGVIVWLFYTALHAVSHSNLVSCIAAIVVGMLSYLLILLLTRSVTEEDILRLPKGAALARFLKRIRLLR